MKSGRRPNRTQQAIISSAGLDSKDWLIVKSLEEELHIVRRVTNELRVINKN